MACEFHVSNGTLPQDELNLYLERAKELYGREPRRITLNLDGEYVDVDYDFGNQSASAASPATWWARWIALTTASAPKSTTG